MIVNEKLLLTSEDVLEAAIKSSNKEKSNFNVDPFVIIFFSDFLLEYLKEEMKMVHYDWLKPYHPYASGDFYRGSYNKIPITAIKPSMGSSTLASVAEDLIYCGAKIILLVCGAWGIGKNVKLLDFLIPTHALGPDGTSIYYGRNTDEETQIDEEIVDLIIRETTKRTENYHVGKNHSKEAIYRLTKNEIVQLQKLDCISMENGELNVLATICQQKNVGFGSIFYSYYNPLEGWRISWEKPDYKNCVELEGEITLAIIKELSKKK